MLEHFSSNAFKFSNKTKNCKLIQPLLKFIARIILSLFWKILKRKIHSNTIKIPICYSVEHNDLSNNSFKFPPSFFLYLNTKKHFTVFVFFLYFLMSLRADTVLPPFLLLPEKKRAKVLLFLFFHRILYGIIINFNNFCEKWSLQQDLTNNYWIQ